MVESSSPKRCGAKSDPAASFLEQLEREPPVRVEGVAVFPTSNTTGIPRTLVRNLKMNGILHEHTIIFSLITERVPRVSEGRRVKVQTLAPGLYRVIARMGFMEFPEVPKLLRAAQQWLPIRTDDAVYFLGRDDIVLGNRRGMHKWRKKLFLFLARNSQYAASSFGIPPSRLMEVGGQVGDLRRPIAIAHEALWWLDTREQRSPRSSASRLVAGCSRAEPCKLREAAGPAA